MALQTGCHGDCQRLCDSTACVWHIMEASEAPGYHVVEAARGGLTDVSVVLKHSAVSVRPLLINDSFFSLTAQPDATRVLTSFETPTAPFCSSMLFCLACVGSG